MRCTITRHALRSTAQRHSTFLSIPARTFTRCVRGLAKAPEQDATEIQQGRDFQKEIEAYKANENSAARLTPAEQLRTLVANESYGTVCTVSGAGKTESFPSGAITPFAVDDEGRVICCLSSLSSHKRDLQKNGKASMVIAEGGFSSMTQSRCTLTGELQQVPDEERGTCRDTFLSKHPGSFWVDFGDFDYMRMDSIVQCNLIAGFGAASKISAEEYFSAQPDPVKKFSKPVCGHMNEDHESATIAIVKHYAGVKAESAKMIAIDRLGMDLRVVPSLAPNETLSVRISFSSPAEDRKAVKDRLVELTRRAAATQQEA